MSLLADLVSRGALAPDWGRALEPVEADLLAVQAFLEAEVDAGRPYLPEPALVLRAFERPMSEVKVLVVGQDPYPTPGHPVGLSFAVAPEVQPLPRSLRNIVTELVDDLGAARPTSGDLTCWTEAGVLLLNRTLTVRPGTPGSHRGRGWEPVTECAIAALARRGGPLVALLWGRQAGSLEPLLSPVPVISTAHPSPLSAHRGFFGSRPFSRANQLLLEQGGEPVDWTLSGATDVHVLES